MCSAAPARAPATGWWLALASSHRERAGRRTGSWRTLRVLTHDAQQFAPLLSGPLQYIEGRGKLVDAHTVDVGGRRVTARNILIATGARAFVPPFEGHEHCIISDNALEVPEVRRNTALAAAQRCSALGAAPGSAVLRPVLLHGLAEARVGSCTVPAKNALAFFFFFFFVVFFFCCQLGLASQSRQAA